MPSSKKIPPEVWPIGCLALNAALGGIAAWLLGLSWYYAGYHAKISPPIRITESYFLLEIIILALILWLMPKRVGWVLSCTCAFLGLVASLFLFFASQSRSRFASSCLDGWTQRVAESRLDYAKIRQIAFSPLQRKYDGSPNPALNAQCAALGPAHQQPAVVYGEWEVAEPYVNIMYSDGGSVFALLIYRAVSSTMPNDTPANLFRPVGPGVYARAGVPNEKD